MNFTTGAGMIRKLLFVISTLSLIACAGNPRASHAGLNARLIRAAEAGRTLEAKALLVAGADLEAHDENGWTAYLAASSNGRLETMKFLKGIGAKTMVDEKFMDGRFLAQVR